MCHILYNQWCRDHLDIPQDLIFWDKLKTSLINLNKLLYTMLVCRFNTIIHMISPLGSLRGCTSSHLDGMKIHFVSRYPIDIEFEEHLHLVMTRLKNSSQPPVNFK